MISPLRYRQVHLDFHTSEHCLNIGANFDADAFAETLVEAHVNSINIFAKCHHGYSYYPTKVGAVHPGLSFDLLGQQIQALHRRGINCPVYYSVMWDELAGREHPEWVVVDKDGKIGSRPPVSNQWGWTTLDVSSGYLDYLLSAVNELMATYSPDGFFFDICFPIANYSPWGKAQMQAAGVNVEDDQAVLKFARKKQTDFFDMTTRFVHERLPNASIFYNSTLHRDMRRVAPYMTHLEVESLPTTGQWGYLHYPIHGRQARTYGKDFLGMNGRFHMSWGDFGGIKTRDQLDYECGTILAGGGKVCVGDQLNPNGQLDPAVYRLMGHTFERIEALEPWLDGAVPTAEIAVLATGGDPSSAAHSAETEGAVQMLLEMGYQLDVIDTEADLSRYSTVIVPDGTASDDGLTAKLAAFIDNGGRLIASGTVAQTLALDALPVRYIGPAPTQPSYLRPDAAMSGTVTNYPAGELADDYDYAFYGQSHVVAPIEDATVFGELAAALFNRTWDHFMGHQHAPRGASLNAPIAVRSDKVLYLAAPLFAGYRQYDYWAYRAMVESLVNGWLPAPLIKAHAPGWAEFSLHTQPMSNGRERQIIHAVLFHPRRTMQPIVHVDQSAATSGLSLEVKREQAQERVYLAPEGTPVPATYANGYVKIELPPLEPVMN